MRTHKCYNLKNKRKKCKKTKKNRINTCLDNTMGGQKRNFTDIQTQNCDINCGKILKNNSNEYNLYKLLNSKTIFPKYIHKLKTFIPKFYKNEMCTYNNNTYYVIENIKNNVGNNPITIDIKIGYKTALKFDSGLIKYIRHRVIDNYFSHSNRVGYRIEGITGHKTSDILDKTKDSSLLSLHKRKKYDFYKKELSFIINKLLPLKKDRQKCFNKINKIYKDFVKPNYNASLKHKKYISFIGSSILIAKGDADVIVKIIDLNHPIWNKFNNYSDKDRLESLDNFTQGFKKLLDDLSLLL